MIDGRTPPVLSMLSSAEEIFKMRKKFRFVLLWTAIASLWLLISAILVVSEVILGKHYGPIALDAFAAILIVIGFPLLLTSPYVIKSSFNGSTKLENFIKEFYPIWVKVRFELSVNPEGNLHDKLISIIENLDDDFRTYVENPTIKKDPSNVGKKFDFIVKGKKRVAVAKVIDRGSVHEKLELENTEIEANAIAKMLRVKKATLIVILTTQNKDNLNRLQINAEIVKGVRTIVASYDGSGFVVEKVPPLSGRPLLTP